MIRVVIERGSQTNATQFPTVSAWTKEVITLGGNPLLISSHSPSLSPPHQPARSLTKMFGQIGQPPHVLNCLGNLFVSVIPWGAQIDVQVAKEDGDVPTRALVPGLDNML
jgi:hypothetical protein